MTRRRIPAADDIVEQETRDRIVRIAPAVLAFAAFAVYMLIERRFDAHGVLDQFNVLFSADPNQVLEAFTEGLGRHRIAHPNLPHIFSFLVRGLAWLASTVSAGRIDPVTFRRALGLVIVPGGAALQCGVLLRLLVRAGRPPAEAILLSVLSLFSLTQLVFGSVPESFALSGLAITLAYALFLRTREREGSGVYWTWVALGVFATGLTITNVIAVGILFGARRRTAGGGLGRTIAVTLAFMALVVGVCVTSHILINAAMHLPLRSVSNEGITYVQYYLVEDVVRQALKFPSAVATAFTDGMPKLLPNFLARGEGITWRFTYQWLYHEVSFRNIAGFALLAILFFLGAVRRGREGPIVPLSRASIAIVASSWVLHSFWGDEQFLYSQHWHVAMIVLAAGALAHLDRAKTLVYSLLGVTIAFVGLNNLYTLANLFARLEEG